MRKTLIALGCGTTALVAQPAAAQVSSVPAPVTSLPKVQVKPQTQTAVTTLRREGPWTGNIQCMTGGNVKMYVFEKGGEDRLSLEMPFEWADGALRPGTCAKPAGLRDDEADVINKWIIHDVPLTQLRAVETTPRLKITTEPFETGVWLTYMLRGGALFSVDARQSGNRFVVTRVDDRPG